MSNNLVVKTPIKNILIIEDEKSLCDILQTTLTHAGYTATATYNGETGLQHLMENKYDLVLLDMLLPKLSGLEVLAKMSENHDTTPVIVLSNMETEATKKEALGMGAKNYFVKSETPLTDIINSIKNFNY